LACSMPFIKTSMLQNLKLRAFQYNPYLYASFLSYFQSIAEKLKGKNKKSDYYFEIISKIEKELIKQILEITNGKKVETAEILGITRNTLRTKMNYYDLE